MEAPFILDPRTSLSHLEIRVTGIVQGVGFRPFVYRTARSLGLTGIVWNDSHGVGIRVQGESSGCVKFINALNTDYPKSAHIEKVKHTVLPIADYREFRIVPSVSNGIVGTGISPDLAVCDECRAEFSQQGNRRYGHVFINCTQCGPRFTIVKHLPYDRPETTMNVFDLCPLCQEEYDNPADRRFHAQPIACRHCGPELFFQTSGLNSQVVTGDCALVRAVDELRQGKILLIQGVGGFHIACDGANENAVHELRRRKKRDAKPFAMMFPNQESVDAWCVMSDLERAALSSVQAPIVLLSKRQGCPVAKSVSPECETIGAILPYAPLQIGLMNAFGRPLVMTSANISDEPIMYDVNTALRKLPDLADAALYHNRTIQTFADDSVVRVMHRQTRVIRRSRGYVPQEISVPMRFDVRTLGFGADIKNAFAIGKSRSVVLSQFLGDLESETCLQAAGSALQHLLTILDIKVERVAYDSHPDYASTRLALDWRAKNCAKSVAVQHHHAHMAACMAENQIHAPTIGMILDGTGYGTDGTIWGGELLYGDYQSFDRVGHLEKVPLLGNDLAARQPWRMALAWLDRAFEGEFERLDIPLLGQIREFYGTGANSALTSTEVKRQCTETSSVGRLIDAIAALVGYGINSQYEGQSAMWLEGKVCSHSEAGYPWEIVDAPSGFVLSPSLMIRTLVDDVIKSVEPEVMAHRAHEGLAQAWARMGLYAVERCSCSTIALGGGCFQNRYLLERVASILEAKRIRVLVPREVPMNDGGIAFGQVCVANAQDN